MFYALSAIFQAFYGLKSQLTVTKDKYILNSYDIKKEIQVQVRI